MCVRRAVAYLKNGRPATSLAQRCTSWRRQPKACVWTPGTNQRGIMYLLDGTLVKIQAPCWVAHQQIVLGSFSCGSGLSNLEQLSKRQKIINCEDAFLTSWITCGWTAYSVMSAFTYGPSGSQKLGCWTIHQRWCCRAQTIVTLAWRDTASIFCQLFTAKHLCSWRAGNLLMQWVSLLLLWCCKSFDWFVGERQRLAPSCVWKEHCTSLFSLQLLGCGILEIEFRQREVVIGLAWDEDDNRRYENCLSWESFEFCFK